MRHAALALALVASTAQADELGLAPGAVAAELSLEANLAPRLAGEPWSLAPDVAAGVTPALTLGVVHSHRALSRVGSGGGLCLAGAAHGCGRVYAGGAVEARWLVARRGGRGAAARLRLASLGLDPWKPWAGLGAVLRLHRGRLLAVVDPELQLGLASRDRGNRDRLRLPLLVGARLPAGLTLLLRSGVEGELATFSETFAVPLGVELRWARGRLGLTAWATLRRPLGPENELKSRHGGLAASWRW